LNQPADNTPNIIILVFDALSARNLSLYGYGRQTSPQLSRFAEKATVYHRHYAGGNFTSPGTASLLTGTYPWTHRCFQQAGIILRKLADHNLFQLIDRPYQKAAFAQNIWVDLFLYQFKTTLDVHIRSTAYSLKEHIHYNDGLWQNDPLITFRAYEEFLEQDYGVPGSLYFSLFDKLRTYFATQFEFRALNQDYPRGIPNFIKYKLYFLLDQVFDGVAAELQNLQDPFVGYFHLWPPHEPYTPDHRFIGLFDDGWSPAPKPRHPLSEGLPDNTLNEIRRQYDEYIANLDAEFGRFYDGLQAAGLLENSYLIVTSDHGQLFERGVNGHVTPLLYDPVVHVPLLISAPGQTSRQDVYSPTSCVDLVPTLQKITGGSTPEWLEGYVLPGFGGDERSDQPVFAVEAKKNAARSPMTHATLAMIKGDYKLIWYLGYPGYEDVCELYNLSADPEELVDLSKVQPEISTAMKVELQAKIAKADEPFRVQS
jgi:arylsulfatase A-like enzyme